MTRIHRPLLALCAAAAVAAPGLLPAGSAVSDKKTVEPVEKEKSLCESILDIPTLYKNKENPVIQKFRIIGRYHGQFYVLDSTLEKIEIIDSAGKEQIIISTADNTITITAEADVIIRSNNGKLALSGNGVEIRSQAEVTIEASQSLDVQARGALTLKGATVDIN